MSKPRMPNGFGAQAKRLWSAMVDVYEFRADELRILEDACREVDLIERLEREIKTGPLMVKGSMGQDVANPLIGEVRQHRTVFARLVKQLDLPDDDQGEGAEGAAAGDRSSAARKAAEARWRGGARGA